MDTKVKIGYGLGAVAFVGCLLIAWFISEHIAPRSMNVLVCIFGATFGWITGILITPKRGEAKDFEKIGGAILTFITGYGLAKLDQLFGLAIQKEFLLNELLIGRVLLAATSFFIGALFVFVGRRYWHEDTQPTLAADAPLKGDVDRRP